jgi:hypothetical protein
MGVQQSIVKAPSAFEQRNAEVTLRDPATIGYPQTLVIELALKTATPAELQLEYGYTDDEWMALRDNVNFLSDLAMMCETVKKEGASFKLKARLQMEEYLKTSWRMVHAPSDEVPSSVKADLIKSTARWAGYDVRDGASANGVAQNAFQININLGG